MGNDPPTGEQIEQAHKEAFANGLVMAAVVVIIVVFALACIL